MENNEQQDLTELIGDKILNVSSRIDSADDKDVPALTKSVDTLVQDYISVEKFKYDVKKHEDEQIMKEKEYNLAVRKANDERVERIVEYTAYGVAALTEIAATTWAFKVMLNANIELGNNAFRDAANVFKRLTSIRLPVIKVK